TGVLRGLQDARTPLVVVVAANLVNIVLNITLVHGVGLGIAGSALGTLIAQTAAAVTVLVVVVRRVRAAGAVVAVRPAGVLTVARTGGWLGVRAALLQAAVTTNTLVPAGLGAVTLAAHQVVGGLWTLLAFALDAVAIAGQALIGSALGSGDVALGRALTRRMLGWGVVSGVAFGLALVVARPAYTGLFTADPAVARLVGTVVIVVALQVPLAGVVYVLDGILIGAGDARYLALAGLVSLALYLPVALVVRHLGAGLVWVWASYAVFMAARAVTLGLRARGNAWIRVGA
ncbi:MATE family efflux transporter, partial [Longispora fulva]|uniref:MATE family efflux transporter n=1 Tax=Longispora fulva TaxID=619741 RepID=UPI0036367F3E